MTLRERVDLLAAGNRLIEIGNMRSLSALTEKTELLRLVGRLDDALEMANQAVRQARFTGDRETLLDSRVRRAQVHQWLGRTDEALTELTTCVEEARGHDWAALESFALHERGRTRFDAGDLDEALQDLAAAKAIRERIGAPQEQLDASLSVLALAQAEVEERRRQR